MLSADGTPVPVSLQQSTIAEYGVPTEGKVVDYCLTPTSEICVSQLLAVARSISDRQVFGVDTGTRTVKLMTSSTDLLVVCRYLPLSMCVCIGGERTIVVADMCMRESEQRECQFCSFKDGYCWLAGMCESLPIFVGCVIK